MGKSDCEEQCDKLENELKKVRQQKFDFEEKSCELERESRSKFFDRGKTQVTLSLH